MDPSIPTAMDPSFPTAMDPSIPATDGTCFFFRLSGELRKFIYTFSLTHDAAADDNNSTDNQGGAVEAICDQEQQLSFQTHHGRTPIPAYNNLRPVCRQLRAETNGLFLSLNTLRFRESTTVGQTFLDFLSACPPTQRQHLRRITLTEFLYRNRNDSHSIAANLDAITTFCSAHPTVALTMHIARINLKAPVEHCVAFAMGIQLAMGNLARAPKSLRDSELTLMLYLLMRQTHGSWARYVRGRVQPRNLMLLPREGDVFNGRVLRRRIVESVPVRMLAEREFEGVDGLVEEWGKWYTLGI
ncbi:hypothetical protein BDV95DRAFT_510 [Massariosphaeria phaeospora]|uniref:Uncharacterized protein n=1 Tax=Massariosphaeria phaeospora TaxID=100035 RepID=A0A7C8IEP0_9PLEO|nr:hypothetical protein BDV95DRAFT_510 [Massariosphaeria phaeospora]